MKKRYFIFTIMFSLLAGLPTLFAQLRLPAIIGSHMSPHPTRAGQPRQQTTFCSRRQIEGLGARAAHD
jgi:hypothetical protein